MKLSKIKLRNYRCFGSSEQVINIDDVGSIQLQRLRAFLLT